MDILIKNGTIVNSDSTRKADILISNDKIVEISDKIDITKNCKLIDAIGKYIIPGGIDPHVHMSLPNPTGNSSDSFYTGSKAALYGGTTTIIDFVTPERGESMLTALEKRKSEAKDTLSNYSFHVSPVEWTENTNKEIEQCIKEGYTSFKVYLAYKNVVGLNDEEFKQVLSSVAKAGGIVTVHCEDGDKIDELRDNFVNKGKVSPEFHPLSRPAELEAIAVEKAIKFSDEANCPLYIVHVSSALSLTHIKDAQQKGQKVYAETCPHYLLLDDSKYLGDFKNTAPYVLSPPIRKIEDQNALWNSLADKTIQTTGTDHCPFMMNQKEVGINDFRKIPNGAGGVEHRLELLFSFGILKNRINLNKWVELTSTNSAKIFGLYPAKGIIAKGSDADVVIWNPDIDRTISVKNHHQNCDSNIFEGFEIKGQAETVIRNGEIVIENAKMFENIEFGKLLKR